MKKKYRVSIPAEVFIDVYAECEGDAIKAAMPTLTVFDKVYHVSEVAGLVSFSGEEANASTWKEEPFILLLSSERTSR